jgi:hypothetical protein
MAAPVGLSKRARVMWTATTDRYDLRDDELRILEDACREVGLIDQMESALKSADGFIVKGSMGQPVVTPLLAEIRQHRNVLASLLRSLKLPDDSGEGAVNQQRQAGQASWAARRRGA